VTERVQKTVLENGVRVLSEEMDGVRSVSVGVLVDAGPKDEQASECGYAHLVEHMLFQGTGQRDAEAIAEMMEIGGGAMGAFTAREYTVYHATVLDEYLPFALEVLGDMLCNSVLPEDALDRQRSVILNEIAGHNDPLEQANNVLKNALWPDHPLGAPTFGSENTIRQATRATLLDFVARHYTANRVVLAAAGNVEHNDFAAQVRDNFWQMSGSDGRPVPVPPRANLAQVIAEPRDLPVIYFALAWPAPAYADPMRYAWYMFAALFGGGATSRLYHRLREEQGMVYHIAAQYQAYGSTGALVVEGATLPQTLVPTLASTLIELLKLSDEDINPDVHHRTLQSLISQHLVSGDSPYVRMSRLALQELYFRDIVPSEQVITGLRSQPVEAIQQVARTIFQAGLPTIALVGPISEELLSLVGDMLTDFGESPVLTFASQPVLLSTAT
jgi:predicted Zn-dependent peptidase